MDYKKLIYSTRDYAEQYKSGSTLGRAIVGTEDVMFDAADAIEALLAERDAAVDGMRGRCSKCKHFSVGVLHFPCTDCCFEVGTNDHWQWRGPQKGGVV